jgi:hypothetical protein
MSDLRVEEAAKLEALLVAIHPLEYFIILNLALELNDFQGKCPELLYEWFQSLGITRKMVIDVRSRVNRFKWLMEQGESLSPCKRGTKKSKVLDQLYDRVLTVAARKELR